MVTERYHYYNGRVVLCERSDCGFDGHHTLAEAFELLIKDPSNAPYYVGVEQ